jgi:hypothetical protein
MMVTDGKLAPRDDIYDFDARSHAVIHSFLGQFNVPNSG